MSLKFHDGTIIKISQSINTHNNIKNPFFLTHNICKPFGNSDRILCLCIKDDVKISENINFLFSDAFLTQEKFNQAKKYVEFISASKSIANIPSHQTIMKSVLRKEINEFDCNVTLDKSESEYETILIFSTLKKANLIRYLHLFNATSTYESYIELKELCDYLTVPKKYVMDNLLKDFRLQDSGYWKSSIMCNLDISMSFIDRSFPRNEVSSSMPIIHSNDTVTTLVERASTDPMNYELPNVLSKDRYVDASSVNYGQSEYTIPTETTPFTEDEVNKMFKNASTQKERFVLFAQFAINRTSFHQVINNSYILDLLKEDFKKYEPAYAYVFGRAWLMVYLEEGILNLNITSNMRHIFKLSTACKLPNFAFSQEDPHGSPYFSLMAGKKLINPKKNLLGLPVFIKKETNEPSTGMVDLNTFKSRFQQFCGDKVNTLFDSLDFDDLKIAVTGSAMTACVQKYSPLLEHYQSDKHLRLFLEHYSESDIDIMCKVPESESVTKYLDIVKKIYNTATTISEKDIKLQTDRSITMIITTEFLETLFEDSVKKLININKDKGMFYAVYVYKKFQHNAMLKQKYGNNTQFYDDHFYPFVDAKNITINVVKNIDITESDDTMYANISDFVEPFGIKKNITNNKVCAKIIENVKFKISSTDFNHSLEIFRTKSSDFISNTVQFHMPCVRAYYDKNEVYCTPSFITSMMTHLCIDIKYVDKTKNSRDICLKNCARGFGTILNKNELYDLEEYIKESPKWSKYTGLSFGTILKTEGSFFKPKMIDIGLEAEQYELFNNKVLVSLSDLEEYYKSRKINLDDLSVKYSSLRTINLNGKVIPFKSELALITFDELNTMNNEQ